MTHIGRGHSGDERGPLGTARSPATGGGARAENQSGTKNRRGGCAGAAGRGAHRVTKEREGRELVAADVQGTVEAKATAGSLHCSLAAPGEKAMGRRAAVTAAKPGG